MLPKIIEYLQKKEWRFSKGKKETTLFFSLSGDNGMYHCVIDFAADTSLLAFISFLGANCPSDKRKETIFLINDINNNLLFGNFEMNTNGEIKYRTSCYCQDVEVTDVFLDGVILSNVFNMDFSAPFFNQFMFGNSTAKDVYDNLFPSNKLPKKDELLIEEKQ